MDQRKREEIKIIKKKRSKRKKRRKKRKKSIKDIDHHLRTMTGTTRKASTRRGPGRTLTTSIENDHAHGSNIIEALAKMRGIVGIRGSTLLINQRSNR